MRLHRLEITAFGPFGGTQTVDFDALSTAGLFLLHGPTGAGKTSVLDAVCFALYGSVPGVRQTPGASLRSDHAPVGTSTEVVLELTVGERRLEITRRPAQQRPKKRGGGFTTEKAQTWLREHDPATRAWNGVSRSHQEIGEEITQLVGMSREQFCQVVLLPQGDFARFLRADAEARGKLLGRLFDTRRFAAVEERLAELRRAAQQQVEEGDERLLALAHRMGQAAGGLAVARTAVDGRPGDPGVADAVLIWAAVARTEAREALDIARVRLDAAETRQGAARAALDAENDLAARQARHADALLRHERLTAHAPERDRLQAALDRSLKADRVAPALGLRQDAEREHTTAHAARARSRAQLPADLADAGAEHLSALEHRLREELGGLEAARRAERRAATIADERAALAREARADDDVLRDTADWLAEWDGVRRGHQERITAAQEAATRAEHLAGRLEPARERLRAAQERDDLAARADRTAERLRTLHERTNEAKAAWLDLKERRLQGIATELASALVPGEACAVCGSVEHPAPARADTGHVDRAAEDAAYDRYVQAQKAKDDAERELAVLGESRASAAARARGPEPTSAGHSRPGATVPVPRSGEDPAVAELRSAVEELEREHAGARDLAATTHGAREALERAERSTRSGSPPGRRRNGAAPPAPPGGRPSTRSWPSSRTTCPEHGTAPAASPSGPRNWRAGPLC